MPQHWGSDAAQVAAALNPGARGVLQVRGGPGTGKTSLLVEVATAHVAAGADPNSVLLLTGSGRLPASDRGALTAALLAAGGPAAARAIREPLVRTVHGYAFAVLQRAAKRAEATPPRLVTGAEQDSAIRELLAGDGAGAWPPSLHAALATDGFATELRDLMARCAERGVDPADLTRLGRRFRRPEWSAAGRFAQQYEQVMLLRAAVGTAAPQATTPALGAAELVGAALEALAADPDLLIEERSRIRLLLVDDAQQLDPQAARLVRVLAAGVQRTVIAGDPDQAVFGFRGAEPTVLLADDLQPGGAQAPVVTLTTSYRCAPAVARAVRAVAGRLPGAGSCRGLQGTGPDVGAVSVHTAGTGQAEATLIADILRRAHLIDGVPWSQMAVIVRSVPRTAMRLPRTLAAAGIPVTVPATGALLAQQPAVAALITVLQCTADGVDGSRALSLLSGPIGRVDPISLRQLQRTLRRSTARPDAPVDPDDRLVAVLAGPPGELPAAQSRALRRVRAVLQAAARSHAEGRDPHHTLWQAWNRSGLQQRWLAAVERGGPAGAQADRDLEAVTALFELAEQYVARTAGATVAGLIEYVTAMQLAAPRTETPAAGMEAVGVLSAHAALGRQWDLVVIAGLQEGLWPNTVPRGGVLGTQRLLDTLHGFGEEVSARAPLLAEERRLLVSALGRARRRLVITAVDGDGDGGDEEQIPSEFFTELAACATAEGPASPVSPVLAPPVLSAAGLVGRLRAVVCAPEDIVSGAERADAARQLARLARAGVPGADPQSWYGLAPVSTAEPLRQPDAGPVTLSPSALQSLLDCPLRWMAERHGGTDGRDLRSTIGSMIHALVAQSADSPQQLLAELDRAWQELPFASPWYSENEHDRHRAMIETFLQWRAQTRGELTEVGTEVAFDGVIDAGDGVRLRGRIDRVERDAAGRLVVIDVKTAKTPAGKDDAQQHAQLAVYQLAVEAGLIGPDEQPGGARLVYPAKPGAAGATEREQDPLTPETSGQWRERIAQAAAATAGPTFTARVNDGCRHCPVRPICPAHDGGCGA